MKDIIEYNKFLAMEFQRTKKPDILEKYIISETLSPIEDYANAVRLIGKPYLAYKHRALDRWRIFDNLLA